MHSLRSVRLTIRFLPGHTLAGIEHTSEISYCSPETVQNFFNLVGTQRNGVEFIRAEEF